MNLCSRGVLDHTPISAGGQCHPYHERSIHDDAEVSIAPLHHGVGEGVARLHHRFLAETLGKLGEPWHQQFSLQVPELFGCCEGLRDHPRVYPVRRDVELGLQSDRCVWCYGVSLIGIRL